MLELDLAYNSHCFLSQKKKISFSLPNFRSKTEFITLLWGLET